jgi:hypothetical protein
MATTKSTVVGIRLDHDRRAWVEAEAARLGVSVRGLFEGMIDEARSGEKAEASQAIAGLGSAVPGPRTRQDDEATKATEGPSVGTGTRGPNGVNSPSPSDSRTPGSSSWPDLGTVTSVPGGLIREAASLTASLIELGGRCATRRLGGCPLTRRWSNRSV